MRGELITYLLLAIYCNEGYQEKFSIDRIRELRIKNRNEIAQMMLGNNNEHEGPEPGSGQGPPSHASH